MSTESAHSHYFETMRSDQIASSPNPAVKQLLADEWDRMMAAHDREVRSKALLDAATHLEQQFGDKIPGPNALYLSTQESRRLRAMDEEERGLR